MQRILADGADKLGVNLSELQIEKLLQYLNILRQWNKVHNLCAQASYEHMLSYHLLDSLSVVGSIDLQSKNILDVGTGAGLPGIVLAIVMPYSNITLLDSKSKKIIFVNHVVNVLGLNNVTTETLRMEKYNSAKKFDVVISRAFASLTDFVTLSARLCSDEGVLIAMKADPSEFVFGSIVYDDYKIVDIKSLIVPGVNAKRSLVIVSKT
jgi:16S rRNA (guanine527-N7)-methyltransferase